MAGEIIYETRSLHCEQCGTVTIPGHQLRSGERGSVGDYDGVWVTDEEGHRLFADDHVSASPATAEY